MFSNRTFGVEIEFIGSRDTVERALRQAGLDASVEGYNHANRPYWKVTTDASVGYDNGELVSPILRGEQGLEDLRKACRAMVAAGIRVNSACGVHVHVGAADLTPQEVVATCIRYGRQESTFDSIMPRSRRESNNHFCRSMNRFSMSIAGVTNMDNVSRMFHGDRYQKLNVQSYLRQKTLEFRQHSGSINATKIANWVKVCTKFVDTTVAAFRNISARQTAAVSTPTISMASFCNPYRYGSMKYRICKMLVEGATIERIANVIGSPAASVGSMISQIKADPATPNVVRTGRRGNYFYKFVGTGDAAPQTNYGSRQTTVTYRDADYVSVFALPAFHGLEDSVVGYYEERAMELAN